MPNLAGRAALVTGAGRRVGRAVDLAAVGAVVAVGARSQEQLAETLDEIDSIGAAATTFVRDLADLDAAGSLLPDVEREFGPIEILVNNAGTVAPLGPTESLEPAEIQHSLRVNVAAPVVLGAMAIPGMRQCGWGPIVNVSSGVVANPGAGRPRGPLRI